MSRLVFGVHREARARLERVDKKRAIEVRIWCEHGGSQQDIEPKKGAPWPPPAETIAEVVGLLKFYHSVTEGCICADDIPDEGPVQ